MMKKKIVSLLMSLALLALFPAGVFAQEAAETAPVRRLEDAPAEAASAPLPAPESETPESLPPAESTAPAVASLGGDASGVETQMTPPEMTTVYDPGDVAVVQKIYDNNGLALGNRNDPSTWEFASWTWDMPGTLPLVRTGRLSGLNLDGKNLRGELNLSGLSSLGTLACHNNQLTSLNVSGLSELVVLFCQNNRLAELNVSGLSSLRSLECFNNQLASLDVSGLTLRSLNCANNQLTSLNLSGNASRLEYLACDNNQLASLNLSGFSVLSKLECTMNLLATEASIVGLNKGQLETYAFFPQAIEGTWYEAGKHLCYQYTDGSWATGWKFIDDVWYYFDAEGFTQAGWVKDGGNWYYTNASGQMQTGWLWDGTSWYFLNSSGQMQTGWLWDGASWFYLHGSGQMATGTVAVDGAQHSFAANGVWLGWA